jgi:hypothetical protein
MSGLTGDVLVGSRPAGIGDVRPDCRAWVRMRVAAAGDGQAARSVRGRPSTVKGCYASLRDGLRPPLTPEPLRPLGRCSPGRRGLPKGARAACPSPASSQSWPWRVIAVLK